MIEEIKSQAGERMKKSVEVLRSELARIRTGRAHSSLLDHITVEYYGSEAPLNQVSNITVEDARTLVINVWEKDMVKKIEKAILESDLGLNPAVRGAVVHVPMPPLTGERRKELVKLVRQQGENARVAVRNVRRDANQKIKEKIKAQELGKDDEKAAHDLVEKMTADCVRSIDEILEEKEKELTEM